ncbi:hypothetical protein [Stackebrandtia nassauensis]|uniref:Uncharacterized protein n=1 Tax=Stackebrandtia nassauensis (strain DSM 44728 / CIP 108903 / NRRL B-16338 / NBRC 102104 / LLR-40K-21) TaxID=446470 RepID=D3Q8V2_STANL|nr:hypothetical protein [Stackebrandtia nassauensis]ADD44544.1 hypothetical protein Snas_4903 [Stackebrandtia nassauensis DSM 44728]
MRKRYLVAAATVVMLSGVTAWVYADPAAPDPNPTADAGGDATVVLPTGDTVTLLPGGGVAVRPGDGRADAGFFRAGGTTDFIMVPMDQAADIASGERDPRRYNVSALLREGQHDAAKAPKSRLDDREYDGYAPASPGTRDSAANQKVTITLKDRHGKAPEYTDVLWSALGGEAFEKLTFDENGVSTTELPAGTYDLQLIFGTQSDQSGDVIEGISTFTVADEPVDLTIDGAKAQPVTAEVDAKDAEPQTRKVDMYAKGSNVGVYTLTGGKHDHYVLPTKSGASEGVSFNFGTSLTSPKGADEPYSYQLAFPGADGVPEDLSFEVPDEQLAEVATDFQSLGTESAAGYCFAGIPPDIGIGFQNCIETSFPVPGDQTVRYTPEPVKWHGYTRVGASESTMVTFGTTVEGTTYPAGPGEQSFNTAPLTIGLMENGAMRMSQGLGVTPAMMNHFDSDSLGYGRGYSGSITLSEGDTQLGHYEGVLDNSGGGFDLEPDASGRFTLTVDGKREADDVTPLNTHSTATWEFDCPKAPGDDEAETVAASYVVLAADGVTDGYAQAGEKQKVTMEYRPQNADVDTKLTDLKFEVSYDDGDSWDEVKIERDGDSATAELDHPSGAKFVSVRFTATDDTGSELSQQTIRSYGLK